MFRDDSPRAENLAKILQTAREKKGYSQEHVARLINVSAETIRKIEQHRTSSPGLFLIADLAKVLDLEIQRLVAAPRRRA